MGNQQGKVSDIEYGWLAGFFDGEGMVTLTVRPSAAKNGGPKIQPLCVLSSTDREALEEVTGILKCAEVGHHVSWTRPRGFAKSGRAYREAWKVTIAGQKRCGKFLSWIAPVLKTKRERAQVAMAFIAARWAHSDPRTPITEHEWAIAARMRQLNSKAVSLNQLALLNTEPPGASSEQLACNGRKGAEARWGSPKLPSTTAR